MSTAILWKVDVFPGGDDGVGPEFEAEQTIIVSNNQIELPIAEIHEMCRSWKTYGELLKSVEKIARLSAAHMEINGVGYGATILQKESELSSLEDNRDKADIFGIGGISRKGVSRTYDVIGARRHGGEWRDICFGVDEVEASYNAALTMAIDDGSDISLARRYCEAVDSALTTSITSIEEVPTRSVNFITALRELYSGVATGENLDEAMAAAKFCLDDIGFDDTPDYPNSPALVG